MRVENSWVKNSQAGRLFGVAPNKPLVKIASDMQKPNGLMIIHDADVERCIWPLGARSLGGVGPKTEAYQKREGIQTIGELALCPWKH